MTPEQDYGPCSDLDPGRLNPVPDNPVADTETAYPDLLESIISGLSGDLPEIPVVHQLITGLSGMGKSTLLTRIETRIVQTDSLDKLWIPLSFADFPFDIHTPDDFWLNCLEGVDAILGDHQHSGEVMQLRARKHENTDSSSDELVSMLDCIAQSQNKRFLLFLDNLHTVLLQMNSGYTCFLETLRQQSCCILIASYTTASRFNHLEFLEADEGFEIYCLQGLYPASSQEGSIVHSNPASLPPLQHIVYSTTPGRPELFALTAGNLRTSRLASDYLHRDKQYQNDVYPALIELLKAITPWYTCRLYDLDRSARLIVDQLARHRDAMSPLQIEENTGLKAGTVSRHLEVLSQSGFLDQSTHNKDKLYSVREQLFKIWYMAGTERRAIHPQRWLIHFLKLYLSEEALQNTARQFLLMPTSDRLQREYIRSLMECMEASPLRNALEHSILASAFDEAGAAPSVRQMFVKRLQDPDFVQKITFLQSLGPLRSAVMDNLQTSNIVARSFLDLFLGSPSLEQTEKMDFEARFPQFSDSDWSHLDMQLNDEAAGWRDILGHHTSVLYKSIASGEMASLDDTRGAESASEHWQNPVIAAISWDTWLQTGRLSRGQAEKILELYQKAIDFDSQRAILRTNLAELLWQHLNRIKDAETTFRKAIELADSPISEWSHLASLLKHLPGRQTEAEQAYLKAIELSSKDPDPLNNMAWFLYQYTTRYHEAIAWVEKALAIVPNDSCSLHTLATLEVKTNNWASAARAIEKYIGLAPPMGKTGKDPEQLVLFREIMKCGKVEETIELFDTPGTHPDWIPVRHALVVAKQEEPDYLQTVDSAWQPRVKEILDSLAS